MGLKMAAEHLKKGHNAPKLGFVSTQVVSAAEHISNLLEHNCLNMYHVDVR